MYFLYRRVTTPALDSLLSSVSSSIDFPFRFPVLYQFENRELLLKRQVQTEAAAEALEKGNVWTGEGGGCTCGSNI